MPDVGHRACNAPVAVIAPLVTYMVLDQQIEHRGIAAELLDGLHRLRALSRPDLVIGRHERLALPRHQRGARRGRAKVPPTKLRVQRHLITREDRQLQIRMRSSRSPDEQVERPPAGYPPGSTPSRRRPQRALTHHGERVAAVRCERRGLVMRSEAGAVDYLQLRDLEDGVDRERRRVQEDGMP